MVTARAARALMLCFALIPTAACLGQVESGPEPGAKAGPLEVIAVAGEYAGRGLDIVAERGDRPTALLFIQAEFWDRPIGRFVRTLDDRLVSGIPGAEDAAAVAVWLTDDAEGSKEYLPKVEAAARTALALDPDLAEAHTALAFARRSNWDWTGAEESFKRALVLNANLPDAHDGYAAFLGVSGRHDEAVAESRLARQLDPLSVVLNTHVGSALLFARRYDEAIQVLNQSRDMDPSSSVTHLFLGYTHAAAGRFADAIAAYDEAIRLGDDSASAQIYLGAAYAGLGQRERAESILRQLETRTSYVSPGELALLYGALGQRDRAFKSLAVALEARDVQLMYIGIDPAFDTLRDDPRFPPLLRAVGLSAQTGR